MEQTEKLKSQNSPGQDMFESQWRQMRGTLRSWWGKLTDNDWERIAGQKDRLLGILQEKYAYTRDMARREMERRFGEYAKQSSETGTRSGSMAARQYDPTVANQMEATSAPMEHPWQTTTQAMHGARQETYEAGAHAFADIDRARAAVGKKMTAFADTLRRNMAPESSVGSATHTVANRLSTAGSYLEEHTLDDLGKEATSLIRRYPVQALLVGFGVGYLVSRGLER